MSKETYTHIIYKHLDYILKVCSYPLLSKSASRKPQVVILKYGRIKQIDENEHYPVEKLVQNESQSTTDCNESLEL